jgi:hypothetical protein
MSKKHYDENDVAAAREYVQAMLGFILYSHQLYAYVNGGGVEHGETESGHKH